MIPEPHWLRIFITGSALRNQEGAVIIFPESPPGFVAHGDFLATDSFPSRLAMIND